jgi:hypothetical protein
MSPSKEYLEQVAKKLETMRSLDPSNSLSLSPRMDSSSFLDQLGKTAQEHMTKKQQDQIGKDPLFPDRNTY